MKTVFIALLAFSTSSFAFAQTVTVDTLYTCRSQDPARHLEVGLALNDGPGLIAIVVEKSTKKLLTWGQVFETNNGQEQVYSDSQKTIWLTINETVGTISGSLSFLQDGPGSISEEPLVCEAKSSIGYQLN